MQDTAARADFSPQGCFLKAWNRLASQSIQWRFLLPAIALLVISGCTALVPPPVLNNEIRAVDSHYGYRFTNLAPGPNNSDGLFLVLAFSGGGTRSAALGYGVLEKLRDSPIIWEGNQRRLLEEIDVINSVSGGSYAAAYYGLHRDDFFTSFPERFLYADFQSELLEHYFSITGLLQLLGLSRNDRIDRLSDLVEQRLFRGKTFADLLAPRQRPMIVIHATDLANGANFQFTQDQLDPLCTDLSRLPIARAVTASSAVPILFGPITLKNYAGTCDYHLPSWLKQYSGSTVDLTHLPEDPTLLQRGQRRAEDFLSYLDASKATGRPWIHLIDGGVSDNLGLRGPLESGLTRGGLAPLLKRIGLKNVRKIVFIVVSAEVLPDMTIDRSGDPPGTTDMASAVIDVFMNNNSFETMTWLRSSMKRWREEAYEAAQEDDSPYAGVPDFYLIEANLRDIEDRKEREKMMAVPTTFKLDPDQIQSLIRAGRTLLDNSSEYKRLMLDLQ